MSRPPVQWLGEGQLKGLERVGTELVPGGDGLPSFRESGCVHQVDRMLAFLPEADRKAFALLLGLFRWLPRSVLRGLIRTCDAHRYFPGPAGAVLRMIRFGVFGTVYTLYYDDKTVLATIGWDANVREA